MKKKSTLLSVLALLCIALYVTVISTNSDKNIKKYPAEKKTIFSVMEKSFPDSVKKFFKKIRVKFISRSDEFIFDLVMPSTQIDDTEYKLSKYSNIDLIPLGPRSYIGKFDDNILIMTGTGTLIYSPISKFKNNKILFKQIKTNFQKLVGVDFISEERIITRSILVKKNILYVSYIKKVNEKCYMNSILSAKINLEKIKFSEIFNTGECYPVFGNQDGGYLADYKKNEVLFSIGDWDWESVGLADPQKKNNLKGKIISINLDTQKFTIKAMGFRNPQGIFYDKKNDIIISTDHGPQGGDEINFNKDTNSEKIKNYGWPVSSYGEHYGFPEKKMLDEYSRAPLYKSHKKYGFIEPFKYFVPSIAPSQVIKTKAFDSEEENIIYLAAMGYDVEEGDLSVHKFTLTEDLKIKNHLILPIGERVRDMFYIEELNKILLFLESSGSIGLLEKLN